MLATIERYAALGVGIVVLCLAVYCGWLYDQRKLDKAALAQLQGTVQLQAADLAALHEGQAADSAAIASVAASAALNAQHGSVVRQRVVTMGNNDAALQTWLDARIPGAGAGAGCLLDDTCRASGEVRAAIGGASAAMR